MWQTVAFSPEQDAAIDACYLVRDRVRARRQRATAVPTHVGVNWRSWKVVPTTLLTG
ncbi:MAG TPA: hypothetical protein VFN11_14845 [Ktedonobacterales bacterium]|nr:hypothetical protein [Ktedonobacterales bacterium]